MAVMAEENDTSRRSDDLSLRVESIDRRMETGFSEVREEFRAIRGEMQSEFQAVRTEMAALGAMLNQTIYRLFGGMLIAWIVGIVAILVRG